MEQTSDPESFVACFCRKKTMDKPHTESSFPFILCDSRKVKSIVALHHFRHVVFQFKERHATFLERKIPLSITQQLEKRFAVKSLGVNICGGKTCTNPLTPYTRKLFARATTYYSFVKAENHQL